MAQTTCDGNGLRLAVMVMMMEYFRFAGHGRRVSSFWLYSFAFGIGSFGLMVGDRTSVSLMD